MEKKTCHLKIILISIIFILLLLIGGNKSYSQEVLIPVQFKDGNMYKVMEYRIENIYRNEIERKDNVNHILYLTQSQIDDVSIIEIKASDNVTDLSGIENFEKVTQLYIDGAQITDLSPIKSLKDMLYMRIDNTNIRDIGVLRYLTNLTALEISHCKVMDFSPLNNMNKLMLLMLIGNDIKNINSILDLPKLLDLDLSENHISDISAFENGSIESLLIVDQTLTKTTQTREVELPQIFKAAKQEGSLIYTGVPFTLENCSLMPDGTKVIITDVTKNAKVTINGGEADGTVLTIIFHDSEELIPIKFKDANLYNAVVAQMPREIGKELERKNDSTLTIYLAQEDLEKVGEINIKASDNVRDLSGIENFRYVYQMSIMGENITDISPLANLTDMQLLLIDNTQVRDITPLSSLTKLWVLDLENNNISDISSLANLKNLWSLNLNGNKISDISVLKDLDIDTLLLKNQTLTINTRVREIELPQIFQEARRKGSKIYTENLYIPENCMCVENDSKAILDENVDYAVVTIDGGDATGTALTINANLLPEELRPVKFKDVNLYNWAVEGIPTVIEKEIEQKDDATLTIYMTQADIDSVIYFGIPEEINVHDLSGIENFRNLRQLYIEGENITDISPLASLIYMYELIIENTNVSDISALSNMQDIDWFGLNNNKISDVSPLANIEKIRNSTVK